MKRLVVHIDNLVLRGFRHEDRHAIAAGLQAELRQLFTEPSSAVCLANTGDFSRLNIGNVQLAQGAKPEAVGLQAARGVARGLTL